MVAPAMTIRDVLTEDVSSEIHEMKCQNRFFEAMFWRWKT